MPAKKLKRGQEVDLKIEKIAFGGQGVAHVDELVVFVDNALPGDVLTAKIRKVRQNYAEAYPTAWQTPSPLRQPAPCEHFDHCGGCKWQNVAYEQQLAFKKQHVAEALWHIGKIRAETMHEPLPAPEIFGYRNKMEFSFSHNRWLTPEELKNPEMKKGFALGLHVPGFFDRVIDIHRCWIQPPPFDEIVNFAREFFRDSGIPAYNVRRKEGILRHLVLRKSFTYEHVLVNVVSFSPLPEVLTTFAEKLVAQFPVVTGVVNTINDTPAQVATGSRRIEIHGSPILIERLDGYEFEISPDSFFQTNTRQAVNLYNIVKQYAEIDDHIVWDLYCGTGSIAIFVADKARNVLGFEIVENAVQDAYRNAALNRVSNCAFVAGDLRFNLERHAATPPDVLICDPPRAGMHQDVVTALLDLAPPRIVYVSCNPATMARDLSRLVEKYRVVEVQPVDMFPHTYHIESVAKLIRL